MQKILIAVFLITTVLFFSCITTFPKDYEEMSINDFYNKIDNKINGKEFVTLSSNNYKLISDVYIESCEKVNFYGSNEYHGFYINMVDQKSGKKFGARFSEDINGRFEKGKIYQVYYYVHYNYVDRIADNYYEIGYINIDKIIGLISVEDYNANKLAEENRLKEIKELKEAEERRIREEANREYRELLEKRNAKSLALASVAYFNNKIDIGQLYHIQDVILIENQIGINYWSAKNWHIDNASVLNFILDVPGKFRSYIKDGNRFTNRSLWLRYSGKRQVETTGGYLRMVDIFLLEDIDLDKLN